MFDLRDFILKTLNGMIGVEPDYKVREIALGWYTKSILVETDLESIDLLIEEKNSAESAEENVESEEPIIEEPLESEEVN